MIARTIGFFYTIFLAKTLGVSDFGLFSVALSYFTLFGGIADFGFNRFLVREVAKDPTKTSKLWVETTLLRLSFTAILFIVFSLGLYIFDTDKLRVYLSLLATAAVFPQSIALTIDAIFIARQKMQFSSLALIILSIFTTGFGIIMINSGFGLIGAVTALSLGQVIYFFVLSLLLRQLKISFSAQVTFGALKKVFLESMPYGILGLVGLVSFKIDTLILVYFRGNFEAGIYSAAYKFFETSVFIPSALAVAIFPVFSRLQISSKVELNKLFVKTIFLMALLGVLFALCYFFILPLILPAILPEFRGAAEVIKILSLAIPFMFVHILAGQVLLSSEKFLKNLIILYFLLFTLNIIFYLVLIPRFGFLGAAWGTVLSEIMTFASFLFLANTANSRTA